MLAACTSPSGDTGVPPTDHQDSSSSTPAFTAVIRRTDFQVKYVLEGQSTTSTGVQLLSNPQLAFVSSVRPGVQVAIGDVIGRSIISPGIRASLDRGARQSSLDRGELEQLKSLEGRIVAPVGGVFVIQGGTAMILLPGIDVVVDLLPIQYLRYQSLSFSGRATVETIVGERTVNCAAVWVQAGSNPSAGTPYELHCRLPSYVETAAGLHAQVRLASGIYRDVVVVPNVYIGYDRSRDGYFISVVQDGVEKKIPITVGVTDGVVRIVTSDVPVGATLAPLSRG